MNILDKIKQGFRKSHEQLEQEAWQYAIARYNIVSDNGFYFITYNGRKVSLDEDDMTPQVTLLDRLHKYREMYVKDYIEREGRL